MHFLGVSPEFMGYFPCMYKRFILYASIRCFYLLCMNFPSFPKYERVISLVCTAWGVLSVCMSLFLYAQHDAYPPFQLYAHDRVFSQYVLDFSLVCIALGVSLVNRAFPLYKGGFSLVCTVRSVSQVHVYRGPFRLYAQH